MFFHGFFCVSTEAFGTSKRCQISKTLSNPATDHLNSVLVSSSCILSPTALFFLDYLETSTTSFSKKMSCHSPLKCMPLAKKTLHAVKNVEGAKIPISMRILTRVHLRMYFEKKMLL